MKTLYRMLAVVVLMTAIFIGGYCTLGVESGPSPEPTGYTTPWTQEAVVSDQAQLVIDGPTTAKIGELVVISVADSNAQSFKWTVLPEDTNILIIEDGKRIVFSSGVGGEFKFIVACAYDGTCDVAIHTVIIEGAPPTPVDGLTSRLNNYCDQVVSDTKRDDCIKLAQSFSSVAISMESGSLATPVQIMAATVRSNQDALGDKLDAWLPLRQGLTNELKRMANSGGLADTDAHIRVWKQISQILKDYAATL